MRRTAFFVIALGAAAACVRNIGVRAEDMPVATSPAGTHAEIRLTKDKSWLKGELLEARDSALVMLNDGRVTVVPLPAIDRSSFTDSMVSPANRDRLYAEELGELRILSRYPMGITPTVMARLLAAHGQTEPLVIAR